MKLIIKNYEINNKKVNNIKICLVSDFHLSHISMDSKFNMVLEDIRNKKPAYICIAGDYIDCTNMLCDKEVYNKSINYLKKLANISKVIITLGNHDVLKLDKMKRRKYYYADNWISEVKSIKNVIYLNSDIYEDNNIRFIGYEAGKGYYERFNENKKILVKDFNKKFKDINNDKYNVVLFHSPIHIFSKYCINNINIMKNIDMILSGHMHNALTPNFIDKLWKSNRGLVSPHKYLFPNNARGIKKKYINGHNIYLVISGGVTKIHEVAPKIFHFLDKLYGPEVTYIDLKK